MKIAVIGSGVSGLSCAWLLSKFARHHVTLFEQSDTLGGHTNTVDVTVDGVNYPVDTGFLVFNDWTYPNLIAMFKHLNVEDALSDMSFSVKLTEDSRHEKSRLEWSGSNLATVFSQPSNLFNGAFIRMLRDVVRFNREATKLVQSNAEMAGTVGDYLSKHHYSDAFRDWYLAPMTGCIWSTPTRKIDAFPLATMLRFCHNHGLLSVNNRPQWRTVKGGARHYVQAMSPAIERIRLKTRVQRVSRHQEAVTINAGGANEDFEQVVFACHSDQVLNMLQGASAEEREILSAVPYQPNKAILHTDTRVLPDRKRAWASWNYHAPFTSGRGPRADTSPVSLTYLLNRLQPLPFSSPVMVTMNPLIEIAPDKVIRTIKYDHPVFLPSSVKAKRALRALQGERRTWYAGAWLRYGFHEDGLMSGIAVAKALGAKVPWETNVPAANDLSQAYPGVDD
jgi:uncharacterized protein